MQEILVKLWCNRCFHTHDRRIEATELRRFTAGRKPRRLDLCAPCAEAFDAEVGGWAAMADEEDARPETRFRAGSKESRDFYAGMRAWADTQGRTAEYEVRHRGPGPHKVNYNKPQKLVDDYLAYLAGQAKAA
jgi:hypothetical protein